MEKFFNFDSFIQDYLKGREIAPEWAFEQYIKFIMEDSAAACMLGAVYIGSNGNPFNFDNVHLTLVDKYPWLQYAPPAKYQICGEERLRDNHDVIAHWSDFHFYDAVEFEGTVIRWLEEFLKDVEADIELKKDFIFLFQERKY